MRAPATARARSSAGKTRAATTAPAEPAGFLPTAAHERPRPRNGAAVWLQQQAACSGSVPWTALWPTASPAPPPPDARMRRLDHAMILLVIVGTYTPVGLLVLHGTLAPPCWRSSGAEQLPGSCSSWPRQRRPDGSGTVHLGARMGGREWAAPPRPGPRCLGRPRGLPSAGDRRGRRYFLAISQYAVPYPAGR
jgi:hypothetical protein